VKTVQEYVNRADFALDRLRADVEDATMELDAREREFWKTEALVCAHLAQLAHLKVDG